MAGFGYTNLEQQFEDVEDVFSEELGTVVLVIHFLLYV